MDWEGVKVLAESLGPLLIAAKLKLSADVNSREAWKAAIQKLQTAVLETQIYSASQGRGEPSNRNSEARLVFLWRDAATGFYALDRDLAERLQQKAEYWTEPWAWTHQQVVDAGIALEHVAQYTRQLLREGK